MIGKCLRDGKSYDDASVSPVVRQTLQHWGYRLTRAHFDAGSARVKAKGAAYLPRSQLAHVLDKKPAAAAPKKRAAPKKKAEVIESESESESESDEWRIKIDFEGSRGVESAPALAQMMNMDPGSGSSCTFGPLYASDRP